jgi:hypothetical protein
MRPHSRAIPRRIRANEAAQLYAPPPRVVERERRPPRPFHCAYCVRAFADLDALVQHRETCGPHTVG